MQRSNLTWRMHDAHLTRKILIFAKSPHWVKTEFAICIEFYNFIRLNETLNRGDDRMLRANIPAMATGVTEHQWTIKELLAYQICIN